MGNSWFVACRGIRASICYSRKSCFCSLLAGPISWLKSWLKFHTFYIWHLLNFIQSNITKSVGCVRPKLSERLLIFVVWIRRFHYLFYLYSILYSFVVLSHNFFESSHLFPIVFRRLANYNFNFRLLSCFANILDLLNLRLSLLFSALIGPNPDIWGVLEPNGSVLILDELTFHSQNLILVQLGHVVTYLVGLLQAISLFIMTNEINIFSDFSEIVVYCCIVIFSVYLRIKLHRYWGTAPNLCFDVGLDVVHSLPEAVDSLPLEYKTQTSSRYHLHAWRQLWDIDSSFFWGAAILILSNISALFLVIIKFGVMWFMVRVRWIEADDGHILIERPSSVVHDLVWLLSLALTLWCCWTM